MYWKARQFTKLAGLPDERLFAELETGLDLIAKNSTQLADAAVTLSQQGVTRPADILDSHATDEAGKFLLLLDAVRCPRSHLQKHFSRAGQHLARLLYADTANLRPATFEELVSYININRKSNYLDGPEGGEWVFRNSMLFWREHALYVDYVELEDRTCQWQDPDHFKEVTGTFSLTRNSAADLVSVLVDVELHRAPALAVLASLWRTFAPTDDTHISEVRGRIDDTIRALEKQDLLQGEPDTWTRVIMERWTFPLWGVDLSIENVKLQALLDERERFSPWY